MNPSSHPNEALNGRRRVDILKARAIKRMIPKTPVMTSKSNDLSLCGISQYARVELVETGHLRSVHQCALGQESLQDLHKRLFTEQLPTAHAATPFESISMFAHRQALSVEEHEICSKICEEQLSCPYRSVRSRNKYNSRPTYST